MANTVKTRTQTLQSGARHTKSHPICCGKYSLLHHFVQFSFTHLPLSLIRVLNRLGIVLTLLESSVIITNVTNKCQRNVIN